MRICNLLILFLIFLFPTYIFSEKINEIIAIVGNHAITKIDLADEIALYQKNPNQIPKVPGTLEEKILNILIDKNIILVECEKESIIVSTERVNNQIKKEIEQRNIPNENTFKDIVTHQLKISWEQYKASIKERLLTEELMQIKVKLSPLTENEIKQWYNANKQKIGDSYKFRLITIPFNAKNVQDELRANKLMVEAKKIAQTNFAKAALLYSKHDSAQNGGDMGWKNINEIAALHPYLASLISQTQVGLLSQEIVIEGSYYMVKIEAKKPILLKDAEDMIRGYLLREKQAVKFKDWLKLARKQLGVKVFLANYEEL